MSLLPFFQLMRIPAVFTAISNIMAAHLIVTQGNIHWISLGLLAISSSFLYSGGMVLNDCFDFEEDKADRPSRPIPSGRITLRTAWLFGGVLLMTGVLLSAIVGTIQFAIASILVVLILFYNGFAKNSFIAAPVMGSCRFANWLLGLSIVEIDTRALYLATPVFLYVCSLTLLSKIETTAKSKVPLATCLSGIILTFVFILWLMSIEILSNTWAAILLIIALVLIIKPMLTTLNNYTPENIQKMVMLLVLGIIPLDAILVFAGGPWWGGIIILLLWIPGRLLARMMKVS